MGNKTAIEWTDATWNPVTGCTKVSEGCRNCYAERVTERFLSPGAFERVELHPDRLDQPLRWTKPRRIFVCSMSDLFHEDVPDDFIDRVFATMSLAGQHVYQVLTKRPERLCQYIAQDRMGFIEGRAKRMLRERRGDPMKPVLLGKTLAGTWPWPHVWLGCTVEDQRTADARIRLLLQTPAAMRWISVEPMLGPVSIALWLPKKIIGGRGEPTLDGLDWVICGGESGPRARPMHPDWVRSIRDQCVAANVRFFFKQWGEFAPWNHRRGTDAVPGVQSVAYRPGCPDPYPLGWVRRVGKKAAGRDLDGRTWDEFPT